MKMKKLYRKIQPVIGIVWIFLLAGGAFAYAMFQGGFVSWFLFYSVMPILIYTVAVAFYPMRSVRVERVIDKNIFTADSTMKVTVNISRRSRFPLFFLIAQDVLSDALESRTKSDAGDGTRTLFFPGFKKRMSFTYRVRPMPRGEYVLQGIEVKTGDMFGFVQKTRLVESENDILVYPRYEDIHHWHPFEQNEEGTRRSLTSFQYDLTSVASVRDYAPGDRLSWLDWKSMARNNKLLTKEFERPLNEDMLVFLNRIGNDYGKEENSPLFEKAVTAAASVVRHGLKQGSSVGLVSFGKEKTLFPMSSGHSQQWKVFYHLAKTKADGSGSYSTHIKQALQRFPQRSSMIIISPVVNDDLLAMIHELTWRKQKVDLFYMTEKWNPLSVEAKRLSQLTDIGVAAYVFDDHDLNTSLKGGVKHATS